MIDLIYMEEMQDGHHYTNMLFLKSILLKPLKEKNFRTSDLFS
jgi:hypothetical protein